MRRMHLFELHEEPWFPEVLRSIFRAGLGKTQSKLGVFDNAIPKIRDFLGGSERSSRVLDLCSGSGQTTIHILDLFQKCEDGKEVEVMLSDLYPEVERFERLRAERPHSVSYCEEPVDALRPPDLGPHCRSIFASLHHFRPPQVRRILEDAACRSEGICVLESTTRSWKSLLATLPMPLLAAVVCGVTLRPWRFSHLLWSVLIPVIPLVVLWDSVVSTLRSYTVEDLRRITGSMDCEGFEWIVGEVPMVKTGLPTTYLIGRKVTRG